VGDVLDTLATFDIIDGVASRLWVLRNPEKLRGAEGPA
jgi:hypothetical protein